jgi:hypothetical protein
MYETAAALMEAELRDDLRGLTKAEDMLALAFRKAQNHWMFTEEQDQFKGALGAVLISLQSGPEFDRVQEAIKSLGRASAILNAIQQGVPVDFKEMEKAPADVIPLIRMWCDAKWPQDAAQRNLEKTLGVRD